MYIETESTSSDSVRQVRAAIRDHAKALAGACVHVFECVCGCVTWGNRYTCISLCTHKIVRKDILEREHILITYSSAFTHTKREISLPSKRMFCQQNTNAQARRVCLSNIQVREPYSEQGPAVPKAGRRAARRGKDQEGEEAEARHEGEEPYCHS
jgi:hypothetical protein